MLRIAAPIHGGGGQDFAAEVWTLLEQAQVADFFRGALGTCEVLPEIRDFRAQAVEGEVRPVGGGVAIEERRGGEAAEGSAGSSIAGGLDDFRLFAGGEPGVFGRGGAEAEFVVEPECPGFDGFFVFVADLIGVDREAHDVELLVEDFEQARVEPGGFAVAEGIEEIETDFAAFEEGERLDVAHGHAVLEEHAAVIGAEGQPVLRRETEGVEIDAAAEVGVIDVPGIRELEAVEFAVAAGRGGEDGTDDGLAGARREEFEGDGRLGEGGFDGDVAALEERAVMDEEVVAGHTEIGARGGGAEGPTQGDFEEIVDARVADVAEHTWKVPAGVFEPGAPVGMRLDGPVIEGHGDVVSQKDAEAFGMGVVFPVDFDGLPDRSEEIGEFPTEIGGEGGTGDAGDFGIIERCGVDAAQTVAEGAKEVVGEAGYSCALGIGAEEEDGFVELDKVGGGTEAGRG